MSTIGEICSHECKYPTHQTERQVDISAQPGSMGDDHIQLDSLAFFVLTGICNAFVKREAAYLSLSLWDKGRPVTVRSRELWNHAEGQLKVFSFVVIYHNY